MPRGILIISALTLCLMANSVVYAGPSGKAEYMADCARCHGADGKGRVAHMRNVPGYISVDLTRLARDNGGKFPRQEVYDAIDGRKRFPAHLVGDMPMWGLKYREEGGKQSEEQIRQKISVLVDYIESIQQP